MAVRGTGGMFGGIDARRQGGYGTFTRMIQSREALAHVNGEHPASIGDSWLTPQEQRALGDQLGGTEPLDPTSRMAARAAVRLVKDAQAEKMFVKDGNNVTLASKLSFLDAYLHDKQKDAPQGLGVAPPEQKPDSEGEKKLSAVDKLLSDLRSRRAQFGPSDSQNQLKAFRDEQRKSSGYEAQRAAKQGNIPKLLSPQQVRYDQDVRDAEARAKSLNKKLDQYASQTFSVPTQPINANLGTGGTFLRGDKIGAFQLVNEKDLNLTVETEELRSAREGWNLLMKGDGRAAAYVAAAIRMYEQKIKRATSQNERNAYEKQLSIWKALKKGESNLAPAAMQLLEQKHAAHVQNSGLVTFSPASMYTGQEAQMPLFATAGMDNQADKEGLQLVANGLYQNMEGFMQKETIVGESGTSKSVWPTKRLRAEDRPTTAREDTYLGQVAQRAALSRDIMRARKDLAAWEQKLKDLEHELKKEKRDPNNVKEYTDAEAWLREQQKALAAQTTNFYMMQKLTGSIKAAEAQKERLKDLSKEADVRLSPEEYKNVVKMAKLRNVPIPMPQLKPLAKGTSKEDAARLKYMYGVASDAELAAAQRMFVWRSAEAARDRARKEGRDPGPTPKEALAQFEDAKELLRVGTERTERSRRPFIADLARVREALTDEDLEKLDRGNVPMKAIKESIEGGPPMPEERDPQVLWARARVQGVNQDIAKAYSEKGSFEKWRSGMWVDVQNWQKEVREEEVKAEKARKAMAEEKRKKVLAATGQARQEWDGVLRTKSGAPPTTVSELYEAARIKLAQGYDEVKQSDLDEKISALRAEETQARATEFQKSLSSQEEIQQRLKMEKKRADEAAEKEREDQKKRAEETMRQQKERLDAEKERKKKAEEAVAKAAKEYEDKKTEETKKRMEQAQKEAEEAKERVAQEKAKQEEFRKNVVAQAEQLKKAVQTAQDVQKGQFEREATRYFRTAASTFGIKYYDGEADVDKMSFEQRNALKERLKDTLKKKVGVTLGESIVSTNWSGTKLGDTYGTGGTAEQREAYNRVTAAWTARRQIEVARQAEIGRKAQEISDMLTNQTDWDAGKIDQLNKQVQDALQNFRDPSFDSGGRGSGPEDPGEESDMGGPAPGSSGTGGLRRLEPVDARARAKEAITRLETRYDEVVKALRERYARRERNGKVLPFRKAKDITRQSQYFSGLKLALVYDDRKYFGFKSMSDLAKAAKAHGVKTPHPLSYEQVLQFQLEDTAQLEMGDPAQVMVATNMQELGMDNGWGRHTSNAWRDLMPDQKAFLRSQQQALRGTGAATKGLKAKKHVMLNMMQQKFGTPHKKVDITAAPAHHDTARSKVPSSLIEPPKAKKPGRHLQETQQRTVRTGEALTGGGQDGHDAPEVTTEHSRTAAAHSAPGTGQGDNIPPTKAHLLQKNRAPKLKYHHKNQWRGGRAWLGGRKLATPTRPLSARYAPPAKRARLDAATSAVRGANVIGLKW